MNTYAMKSTNSKYKYVQFVNYIKRNPGLKRREIMKNMGYVLRSSGQLSDMWAKLLATNKVRFDKSYRYFAM